MRSRRFSSLAGWAALALVAAVGFAAFGGAEPSADELRVEAAAASLGHDAGAYAGLSFAKLSAGGSVEATAVADPDPEAAPEAVDEATSTSPSTPGTSASPTSGWLSQVEVRELVSRYFEPADVNRAVRVAWCESKFDPEHEDLKSGGEGLFNHLPQYWEERSSNAGFAGHPATDAEASTAAAAWEVYNGAGWEIFSCR